MITAPRTAVVTIVHGRLGHLDRQREGLSRQTVVPDLHVVVRMDDDTSPSTIALPTHVVDVQAARDGLPLAHARNVGASAAIDAGAELLVFLDVDCIPGDDLVRRYQDASRRSPGSVLCGPVTYLSAPPAGGYRLADLPRLVDPHPARPAPAAGVVDVDPHGHALFWSLSFAVTAGTWRGVGGFEEAYVGYGGEDTDFGQRLKRACLPIAWVGGADAFHQHHSVSRPPVEHVVDIVRNARLFHERWGWWPMRGWLEQLESLGRVAWVDGAPVVHADPGSTWTDATR